MALTGIRIIVLNYEGKDVLPLCLPSVVEAAKASRIPATVSVLHNPSSSPDTGLDYVRKNFPQITIHESAQNRVLCSFNDYLPKVPEPVVILLNNDIRVERNFVDPLVRKFEEDPSTFLVAPRVLDMDGKSLQAGRSRAGVRWGIFWCDARYPGYEKDEQIPSETYSSGFGAFSRSKFLKLGGYDDRYLPGIMEDVDLSYRAMKKGYKLYYEPASTVYHIGQVSFKKTFGSSEMATIAHRNNFLFMWKNFKSPLFWIAHVLLLPLRLIFAALRGNFAFVRGFFRALQTVLR